MDRPGGDGHDDHPAPVIPRLPPRYTRLLRQEGRTSLVGGDDWAVFGSGTTAKVLALVDGRTSDREIAEQLSGEVEPQVVHYVLHLLKDSGWLVDAQEVREPRPSVQPVERTHTREVQPSARAQAMSAAWFAADPVGFATFDLGRIGDDLTPTTALMVADPLDDRLREAARQASRARIDVIVLHASADVVAIGPRFRAGRAPCIECLLVRMRLNRPEGEPHDARRRPEDDPSGMDAAILRLDTLLRERREGRLDDRLLELGPRGDVAHPVGARPQCGECGDRSGWAAVMSGPTQVDGVRPEPSTVERLQRLISPVTGVVHRVDDVPIAGVPWLFASAAAFPSALPSLSSNTLAAGGTRLAGGSASTAAGARTAALVEALTRHSARFEGYEPTRVAPIEEMGEGAVPPNALELLSESQYAGRRWWNAGVPVTQRVPEPFASDEPIAWSPAWSLLHGRRHWVPTALAYLGFEGAGGAFGRARMNGVASGRDRATATLRGLLDLIERDAVAIWWYNRLRLPPAPDTPELDLARARHRELGRRVWSLDLTHDLGVPVVAAVSGRAEGGGTPLAIGFGVDLDPRRALALALAEVGRMLPVALRPDAERTERLLPDFGDAVEWFANVGVDSNPWLSPDTSLPRASTAALERTGDVRLDLDLCLGAVARAGLDVFAIDLTRPDVGLPVVRVLAPGMRDVRRRLAPGRLYDVPVASGRSARPTAEFDMNPVAFPT